jgi:hypothetical protein
MGGEKVVNSIVDGTSEASGAKEGGIALAAVFHPCWTWRHVDCDAAARVGTRPGGFQPVAHLVVWGLDWLVSLIDWSVEIDSKSSDLVVDLLYDESMTEACVEKDLI